VGSGSESTLLTYEDLQLLATFLSGFVLALGVLLWWVIGLLDKGCPSCLHCTRKRKQDSNPDSERERLFGIRRDDDEKNK
jgi:hypothetical protein